LPQHQNSTREPLTRERKQGLLISAIVHILLAILIILVTFRVKMPELSEEGLLVNFGYDETGEGLYEPAPQPVQPPPPPPSTGDEGSEEAILTQDFEEAPEVEKKKPDPEELRKQAEARAAAEKRRQEEAAIAARLRREQEKADSLRRVEEEKQQRIQATNTRAANAFSNTSNTGTTGQSQGVAGGPGNQGVESGTEGVRNYGEGGGSGDNRPSYDLTGRRAKSLPLPQYDIQDDGVVTVEVRVNRAGDVIMVRAGVPKTTVTDVRLIEAARKAALKTKFDSNSNAPEIQIGTITYNFKLK
jgi:colicin import membrane protein